MKNELRIGNYVSFENADFNICKVNSIFITHFKAVNISTYIDYGDSLRTRYKPIPLTEEWLVKLGFDFNNKDYFLSKKGFDICFEKQGGLLKCFLDSIEIDIKHVHQLQNIYFALTGQELTINE